MFQIILFGKKNSFKFPVHIFLLFFSEIKALQEIEDHENVCTKEESKISSFLLPSIYLDYEIT